jgi:hypothetical protein
MLRQVHILSKEDSLLGEYNINNRDISGSTEDRGHWRMDSDK